MASSKEAIVLCLDTGPHMRIKSEAEETTPLEAALECIHWILQRRIFSESNDEIGLVVFGTEESNNPLSQDEQYKNISVLRELSAVDWNFVKILNDGVANQSSVESDILDALIVALDVLHGGTEGKKFARRSIVLFSNLCAPFSDDQLENVTEAMKNNLIEFAAIGPSFADEDGNNSMDVKLPSQQQVNGEKMLKKIVASVDGTCLSLNQALPLLSYFSRRQTNPTSWKCNFEIGPDIRIPICMYVKTKENKIKQSWKFMNAQDSSAEISAHRTYHKRIQSDDEDDEKIGNKTQNSAQSTNGTISGEKSKKNSTAGGIDKDETVKAYKYGTSLVPLDKLDLDTVRYKNDGKSFKLLAFTHKTNIKRYYFMGDGAHIVLPDPADQFGCVAFSAILKAMQELKSCALIRYAYNVAANPKVGVLIPETDSAGVEHFVYVPLPFSEDCRFFPFASLNDEHSKPTEEQSKAIDSFIDCMNLNRPAGGNAQADLDAFDPVEIINPYTQYVFQCLQHRLLRPDEPLPEPSQRLMSTISPSESRLNLAQPFVKSVQECFKLERVVKAEKRTCADIFSMKAEGSNAKVPKFESNNDELDVKRPVKISTVRPVEDFRNFVENNADCFEEACSQLSDIIRQFIFDCAGSQFHAKALECCEIFREISIKMSKPGFFNQFISKFKPMLLDCEKIDFWNKICHSKCGLIFDSENLCSKVSMIEADDFLLIKHKEAEVEANVEVQEKTDESLLDELE